MEKLSNPALKKIFQLNFSQISITIQGRLTLCLCHYYYYIRYWAFWRKARKAREV